MNAKDFNESYRHLDLEIFRRRENISKEAEAIDRICHGDWRQRKLEGERWHNPEQSARAITCAIARIDKQLMELNQCIGALAQLEDMRQQHVAEREEK